MDVDSGLEILHGGVGGDVEQGARTSKHIFVFAFDPLSLNPLFICVVHYSFISYCLCCALHYFILSISYMLGCVCASLVLNHESFI